jgi:hypothetical protein
VDGDFNEVHILSGNFAKLSIWNDNNPIISLGGTKWATIGLLGGRFTVEVGVRFPRVDSETW